MEQVKGRIKIYFEITEDKETPGYYIAEAPGLEGCFTGGWSVEEARKMIQDVILTILEDHEEKGTSIPLGKYVVLERDEPVKSKEEIKQPVLTEWSTRELLHAGE